jgi:hypothetical protein
MAAAFLDPIAVIGTISLRLPAVRVPKAYGQAFGKADI